MQETFYLDRLYPFQEEVLHTIEVLGLEFYLTGGTALSRCYTDHRYSDDLDFFVNDCGGFKKQCKIAINGLKKKWTCEVATTSDSFVRIFAQKQDITLKVDFVNDVSVHFGKIQKSKIFNRVDSWRNILSNKLCALSRQEAKDIADIIFIAKTYHFEWRILVSEAKEKDLWVDPLEICKIIKQFPVHLLESIKWIKKIEIDELKKQIDVLHDDIFIGSKNSLVNCKL